VRLGASILLTDRDLQKHLASSVFSLVEVPSIEHAEAARILFRGENRLRRKVGEWFGEVEETWWPSRFPPPLVREIEQRRRAEAESPAPSATDVHPLAYFSFGELVDTIAEERNWDEVFRLRIGLTRDAFTTAIAAIVAVRNKVAHNRPVDATDVTALRLSLQRLDLYRTADG
jgi:hypothetical protein